MIFLTVGTQLPFDRLVRCVDELAGENDDVSVFAQIGAAGYRPKNIDYCSYLSADDFYANLKSAELVVSHAGMGTVINCALNRKPVVVFPRVASLGEHRSDHQLATARKLAAMNKCVVAWDESQLIESIKRWDHSVAPVAGDGCNGLLSNLHDYLNQRKLLA